MFRKYTKCYQRARVEISTDRFRQSRTKSVPDWFDYPEKENMRSNADLTVHIHRGVFNIFLTNPISKKKLSEIYVALLDGFWRRTLMTKRFSGPRLYLSFTPPWLRKFCTFTDVFTGEPIHNFPFYKLQIWNEARVGENNNVIAALLCAWIVRKPETRHCILDAIEDVKGMEVKLTKQLIIECITSRSEESRKFF